MALRGPSDLDPDDHAVVRLEDVVEQPRVDADPEAARGPADQPARGDAGRGGIGAGRPAPDRRAPPQVDEEARLRRAADGAEIDRCAEPPRPEPGARHGVGTEADPAVQATDEVEHLEPGPAADVVARGDRPERPRGAAAEEDPRAGAEQERR